MVAQDNSLGTIIEVYLDLREEVVGISKDIKINTKE